MAKECFDLPDDVLVQVLLLLPTSSRRRFRLVCKRWHDLIDERTPERQSRTKILTFFAERGEFRALVFDDEGGGGRRRAWTFPCSTATATIDIVGTCNGLLCLHETSPSSSINAGSSSVISVTNPITGETRVLPPLPTQSQRESARFGKYSFGYHPITGEYKVVHIPCRRRQEVDVVSVFTLGADTTSWREVPVTAPGASYSDYCRSEVVSVDGVMYWLTAATNRIMELDLGDERVTWLDVPPPVRADLTPEKGGRWRLTSVHARLGIAATTSCDGVEVWVLDGRPRWARGRTLPEPPGHHGSSSWIKVPRLTYGEYAVTVSESWLWGSGRRRTRLYRHKVGSLIGRDGDDGRLLPPLPEGVAELVMDEDGGTPYHSEMKTFAYVETLEPLPGY